MRPYVQEIIDLTKQVDDLTSDNVDLKEQLKQMKHCYISNSLLRKLEKIDEWDLLKLCKQKDILWEYISDKDVDEISARFNKL